MCQHSTMSNNDIRNIENWAYRGCVYSQLVVLARPTARKYPNTYVFLFENATQIGGQWQTINVDVHYEGNGIDPGRSRVAIGGLWISGIQSAMKPTRHRGQLLRSLSSGLPGNASKIIDGIYGQR